MSDPFYPALRKLGQHIAAELSGEVHERTVHGSVECYVLTQFEYYALLASVCTEEELEHIEHHFTIVQWHGSPVIWE